jgi:hypothetical protein
MVLKKPKKSGGTGKKWIKYLLVGTNLILPLQVLALTEEFDSNLLQSRQKEIEEERVEKDRFFKENPKSPLRAQDIIDFKKLDYYPIDLSKGTPKAAPNTSSFPPTRTISGNMSNTASSGLVSMGENSSSRSTGI